jgi:hypothetical protein
MTLACGTHEDYLRAQVAQTAYPDKYLIVGMPVTLNPTLGRSRSWLECFR